MEKETLDKLKLARDFLDAIIQREEAKPKTEVPEKFCEAIKNMEKKDLVIQDEL